MTKNTERSWHILAALLLCLFFTGVAPPAVSTVEAPAEWMQTSLAQLAGESSQVLLVVGDESMGFTARLHLLEKRGNVWKAAFPHLAALIGAKGFAPPGWKKEGDVKTPSGVFALKRTFGYPPNIPSRMPYRQVMDDDIWVDDISSPDYNRWVKAELSSLSAQTKFMPLRYKKGETAAVSFEIMKRPDHQYKYGIVIEYNTEPVVKGAGSAIFFHVRRGENKPTLGCVALAESDMLKVLGWLDPGCKPLVVLGTRQSIVSLFRGAADE
ncbi:MAG: L,D-transpeptidase family protein [Desulforhopalus sp.]|nr:L,D-transpeptidase family protein [Desulforhopalus sp.]